MLIHKCQLPLIRCLPTVLHQCLHIFSCQSPVSTLLKYYFNEIRMYCSYTKICQKFQTLLLFIVFLQSVKNSGWFFILPAYTLLCQTNTQQQCTYMIKCCATYHQCYIATAGMRLHTCSHFQGTLCITRLRLVPHNSINCFFTSGSKAPIFDRLSQSNQNYLPNFTSYPPTHHQYDIISVQCKLFSQKLSGISLPFLY